MRYLALILALFINCSLSAQPLKLVSPKSAGLDREHLKYADAAINEAVDAGYIPGAVLAVVRKGHLPYIKAYGSRSLYPTVEPMSEDTIFDIASCTKPAVTAIVAMKLIEQGKISLRDNVDRYISNFNENKIVDGEQCLIRVAHLMTHTSGLDPYVLVETLEESYENPTRDSLVDYIVNNNIKYAPGEKFQYSCLNFILMQHIIEQVTGESIRDYAKRNIFDPLGMESTDYIPLDSLGEPIDLRRSEKFDFSKIAPTEIMSDSTVIRGVVHDPLAREVNFGVSGNAGVFTTAADMAKLLATLLNDGVHDKYRLLSPLTMKAMRTVPDCFLSKGRALGWDVSSTYSSNRGELLSPGTFGHTGFTGTSIVLDMENDVAVILLTNAIHSQGYVAVEMLRLRAVISNIVAASILD